MITRSVMLILLASLTTTVCADARTDRKELNRQDESRQPTESPQPIESRQRSTNEAPRDSDNDKKRTQSTSTRGSSELSERQAASRAQAQYGGRVLRVTDVGPDYRVRLLLDNGRVVDVPIRK